MKTIAEVSHETLKLEAFVRKLKHGETVTYAEIHKATGVPMDTAGKAKLRTATKRADRVSACIRGIGVRMSNAALVLPITGDKVRRVRNGMRKVETNLGVMLPQHGDDMDAAERAIAEATRSAFASLRVSAEARARELAAIEKKKPPLEPPCKPTI